MKNMQKGFTLIELMIVITIIGILAAIAIPQYQEYTGKGESANAMAIMDTVKKKAEIACNAGDAALTLAQTGVAGTQAVGTITLTYPANCDSAGSTVVGWTFANSSPTTNGKTITWTRTNSTGAWACTTTLSATYKSKACI